MNSFVYYPQETCDAAKQLFGSALDEVCSKVGAGGGGNNNSPSSTGIALTRSTIVTIGSTTTRPAVTVTTATGTAAAGTAARSSTAAGTAASSSTATGSRQTQTLSSATPASALTRWEILIGLAMLAVSI